MTEVRIENPGSMSIMGLILKKIVDNNISNPARRAKIANLDSTINIQAGKMKIHLVMKGGDVEIRHGWHANPTATVVGSMDAIMAVGKGHYHKVPLYFITRNFKVGGNLFALLPLMSIMKM